jgi:hypothetical protein
VAQLYPRALGSLFVASYDSQEYGRSISNPPSHGKALLFTFNTHLIVGFCILLRVYPLMLFLKTTVRNNVFVLDFIVHYLLQVSALIGGHLQVIRT